jgi:hypothetical protein
VTAFNEARAREEFEAWWKSGIGIGRAVPIGTYDHAREAYLAAARHYSAASDALRAERDADEKRIESMERERDGLGHQIGTLAQGLMALGLPRGNHSACEAALYALTDAHAALPDGFKVDTTHSLADRVAQLAAEREKARLPDPSHPAYRMGMDDAERALQTRAEYSSEYSGSDMEVISKAYRLRSEMRDLGVSPDSDALTNLLAALDARDRAKSTPPAPSPLERARGEVVETGMAYWERCRQGIQVRPGVFVNWDAEDKEREAVWEPFTAACTRLRALSQPAETDAVREARDIVLRAVSGNMGRMEAKLSGGDLNRLRDLLDSALAAREPPK